MDVLADSWLIWLLTTPLGIGLVVFIVARFQLERQAQKEKKRCPRCAELIQRLAVVCRYCGYEYTAAEKDSKQELIAQLGERWKREAVEAERRRAEEKRREQEAEEAAQQYAALEGYKLSLRQAAQAISVTRGTLQEYIKSGRLRVNPDGTIEAVELLRAGFIVRNLPPHEESGACMNSTRP